MKLKTFLAMFVSALLVFSLAACDIPQEKPDPKISVADITLQEEEIKDIAVVFDPADAVEDYTYEIIEGEEFISIRNDKVTGVLAGVATVKVTTAPSGYTTTFKVTVTPDPTDPIDKFNAMGGFEGASVKELGWTESTAGQMAPDGENKRTDETALKVYGGWDESTETSLTFDYTISANLKRVPVGDYTLSYFRKGGVATEVKINNAVSEMTWTYNDAAGWEQFVCHFNIAQQSDVSISFHFVADEESDNATERWTAVDDVSILKYKYVKMTIADFELDLNVGENITSKAIDNTVYTISPALGETESITDFVLSKDDENSAITIDGNNITAAEVGTTDVTASFKYLGTTFTETFKVTVVDTSLEGVLGGIYKQTVDTINDIGDFETPDWAIATLGFANYISDESITEAWTVGDWKNSGTMAYRLSNKDGLPAGKKIGIYLNGLNFKAGNTYTVKYYSDLPASISGAAKIFSTLNEINPYTDTALFSASAIAGSGFVEQIFTFDVKEDLNDVVLIFVFENTGDAAAWGCLDDISVSYEVTVEDIYQTTIDTINNVGDFETDDWAIATLGFANYISDDSITVDWTYKGDSNWYRSATMAYRLSGDDGLAVGKKIGLYLEGLNFKAGYTYTVKYYTDLPAGISGAAKIFANLDENNPYTDTTLFSANATAGSDFVEQTFTFNVTENLNDVVLIFVFENTGDTAVWGCLDDISISYALTE